MSRAPAIPTVTGSSPDDALGNPLSRINSLFGSIASVSPGQHGPLPSMRYWSPCPHLFSPNSSIASLGAWLNAANSSERTGETTSPYEYSRDQIRGLHTNSIMRLRQSGEEP
jgi:hypothetical protein